MNGQESAGRYRFTVGWVSDEKREASHGLHGRHAFAVLGYVTDRGCFEVEYSLMRPSQQGTTIMGEDESVLLADIGLARVRNTGYWTHSPLG